MRIAQEERTGYVWPVILNVTFQHCVTRLKPLHLILAWE